MQENKRASPNNITSSDRKVLNLLRSKEEERKSRIDAIAKNKNPTMDDF
jgi:hypothetical protein